MPAHAATGGAQLIERGRFRLRGGKIAQLEDLLGVSRATDGVFTLPPA